MAYVYDLGIKTDDLPITTEAKVFYLTNCLRQYDYVKGQQDSGIEHPKIKLDLEYVRLYYQHHDLAQRDMDLIIEEPDYGKRGLTVTPTTTAQTFTIILPLTSKLMRKEPMDCPAQAKSALGHTRW